MSCASSWNGTNANDIVDSANANAIVDAECIATASLAWPMVRRSLRCFVPSQPHVCPMPSQPHRWHGANVPDGAVSEEVRDGQMSVYSEWDRGGSKCTSQQPGAKKTEIVNQCQALCFLQCEPNTKNYRCVSRSETRLGVHGPVTTVALQLALEGMQQNATHYDNIKITSCFFLLRHNQAILVFCILTSQDRRPFFSPSCHRVVAAARYVTPFLISSFILISHPPAALDHWNCH